VLDMSDKSEVLKASVKRLGDVVEPMGADELRTQAYPSEWKVADVLSHLGSGAVLFGLRLEQANGGPEVEAEPVWAEWNAKDPEAKSADALRADQGLEARIDALTADQRATLTMSLGPMNLDLDGMLRLRIAEHALHRWDIDVAFDPAATVDADALPAVLEILPMISGFAGKPTGSTRDVRVRTSAPDRGFVVSLAADRVAVTPDDTVRDADLDLPAEAFVRLVYGRLDPEHTPATSGSDADLDELRRVFPGI
jgi:uncharacterized protein (TIGR03083 family)